MTPLSEGYAAHGAPANPGRLAPDTEVAIVLPAGTRLAPVRTTHVVTRPCPEDASYVYIRSMRTGIESRIAKAALVTGTELRRSDMDARVGADREVARWLLQSVGLELGDTIVVETANRAPGEGLLEVRTYLGQVSFAFVTRTGDLMVTYSGKSQWAPGSAAACVIGSARVGTYYNRLVRKATREDRQHGYSFGGREVVSA